MKSDAEQAMIGQTFRLSNELGRNRAVYGLDEPTATILDWDGKRGSWVVEIEDRAGRKHIRPVIPELLLDL